MKSFEGKPEAVRRAMGAENYPIILKRMGHVGGEHAALNRIVAKAKKAAAIAERVEELARVETLSREGDVLPPELPMAEDTVVH